MHLLLLFHFSNTIWICLTGYCVWFGLCGFIALDLTRLNFVRTFLWSLVLVGGQTSCYKAHIYWSKIKYEFTDAPSRTDLRPSTQPGWYNVAWDTAAKWEPYGQPNAESQCS